MGKSIYLYRVNHLPIEVHHHCQISNQIKLLFKMSAQLCGRQSPPPECQTGPQENSPTGSGHIDHKFAPGPEYAPLTADAERRGVENPHTAGLTSNPKHILEDIEARKYHKGPGNEVRMQ